ncbi:MAG: 50S ribosomal protein L22 [Patescibacteria group bacterium]|nr:50S ribosomal protein L22 [Patescibacteria group bacterium]MDE1945824.1 50S ribosomal protein L22 [Patescibacteria group bacterium]
MIITAKLSDYRQSPRKVRLVANLVKGKTASDAADALAFLPKRAGKPLADLLASAVANAAHNFNISADKLFVRTMRVDSGMTLKRRRPRARGMAFPIAKRTSRVMIELDTTDAMPAKKKAKAKATK